MSSPVRSTAASLRVFLEGMLDYAGLFAPASLDMSSSVKHYARYLRHPQGWALGRFVLPVAMLDEFLGVWVGGAWKNGARKEEIKKDDMPAASGSDAPWRLSGILSASVASELVSELAAVAAFNRAARGVVIDSVELRVSKPEDVELVRKAQPPGTTMFFEIAPERAGEMLPVVSRSGGCAKLRTGGVVAEAFPAIETIAGFLARCAELGVPFKATAGLHHPLRCSRPLTYEADSKWGTMHGFLNLITAAAIAWSARQSGQGVPLATVAACLADTERADWHFGEDALTWSGGAMPVRIAVDALGAVRSKFALSFGTCSFEEPIDELRGLDL